MSDPETQPTLINEALERQHAENLEGLLEVHAAHIRKLSADLADEQRERDRWTMEAMSARAMLDQLRASLEARKRQHAENLEGWREGVRGQSAAVSWISPAGYLVPTEPDPEERERVRRELRAAIATLDQVLAELR